MSIRLPLKTVLTVNNTNLGSASTAGGYAYPFKIPQDTDNIVVRFRPSIITGHMGAILQTSPDGGSTYYDVARTSTLSLAYGPQAEWLSAPVIGAGYRTGVIKAGSVLTAGIGNAAASTLGNKECSGLPILGLQNRIFLVLGGGATVNDGSTVEVMVNNQSPTA